MRWKRWTGRVAVLAIAALCISAVPPGSTTLAIESLVDAGRYAEAESTVRSLLDSTDTTEHLAAADLLVRILCATGRGTSSEAQQLSDSVLQARFRRGDHGQALARSFVNRSVVLREAGEPVPARTKLDAALAELSTSDGKLKGQVLAESAWLSYVEGDFARGIAAYDDARKIFERTSGTTRLLAGVLNNQAILLKKLGRYSDAEERYRAALPLMQETAGFGHPFVALVLNNLGILETSTAQYESAREHFEAAVRILDESSATNRKQLAQTLLNFGALLHALNQPDQAEAHYQRAAELIRRDDAQGSALEAQAAADLGSVVSERGDFARAEQLLRQALAIHERIGTDEIATADTLLLLADVLAKSGRTNDARALVQRATAIFERVLGHRHPKVADALLQQGELALMAGEASSGLGIEMEASSIREQFFGPEHPATVEAWYRVARALWLAGNPARCATYVMKAETANRQCRRIFAQSMSEEEALQRDAGQTDTLGLLLSTLQDEKVRRHVEVAAAWDAVIRSRALVEDEAAARRRWSNDVVAAAADFSRSSEELSRLLTRAPENRKLEEHERLLRAARDARQRAERAFATTSREYRERATADSAGYAEVKSSLPPGAALVAFVKSRSVRYVGGRPGGSPALRESGAQYAAFVQIGSSRPSWLPLGSADRIDRAVERWKAAVLADRDAVTESAPAAQELLHAGMELRRLIWDSVRSQLSRASLILVVPDGELNWVNIGALPGDRGRFVVEDTAPIHYLGAERDLVRLRDPARSNRGILLVGGVEYGSPTVTTRVSEPLSFGALPGSEREVRDIAALWSRRVSPGMPDPVRLLTGKSATEEAVRQAAAECSVLHLATHGFMASGPVSGLRSARSTTPAASLATSGLALASANEAGSAVRAAADRDGLLTSEEIVTLDLERVAWVVLSGCGTGLGEARPLEGVLGLRRAFRIAGARTVVVSLWPVSDGDAAAWMKSLYMARLSGVGTAAAAKQATLAQIAARRSARSLVHPAAFAAFIADGDWR